MKNFEFYSDGYLLRGRLYLPKDDITNAPVIIMCHGFAGVQDLLLPNFAKKFIEDGYCVFTFDYRGFGQSEGEQGRIVPREQINDIINAITFVSSLEEIDSNRIALWGTSLGGANALIVSALDKRVKALSIQITFANGERNNSSHLSDQDKIKKEKALEKANLNAVLKNKVMKLPLKRILSDEQSTKFFEEYKITFPEALAVKIPFITTKYIDELKAEDYFHKINIPVLVVGATKDIVNNPKESQIIYDNLPTVNKKILMVEGTHYDIYIGENLEKVSKEQIEWYNKYL